MTGVQTCALPILISPPSKAGPAEHAQLIIKSEFPNTSSPFVPRSINSELYICGIINPKGKFIREGKRIKHDKYGMGSYILAFEEEAGSVKDVEITEVDIDNFIRAKGAIFSAIRTMLTSLDFDVSMIDDVYVAGGIGSGINMQNAVNIGMFPDIPIEKFHYIGNSSLTGAYLMLLSTPAEKKTYELAANMTYMELSTVPIYMDEFVGACFIPHTDTSMFPTVMEEIQNR